MLASTKSIPADVQHLLFQRVSRVRAGAVQLKIEYWKEGQYIDANYSQATHVATWTLLSVKVDPEKAQQADELKVSLSLTGEPKLFSADIDNLSVVAW